MNEVINQIGGFYSNSIYYADTDSLYMHKKYCSLLVDIGFVDKLFGLGKNDYGNSGMFYASFLAPKLKYCLVIDDFGNLSAKTTFKGYSEEYRLIKLNQFTSLSERKTVSWRFSIDWGIKFGGRKLPHKKQDCLDCDIEKTCSDCIEKPKMNCFNSKMERACKKYLDQISKKKLILPILTC